MLKVLCLANSLYCCAADGTVVMPQGDIQSEDDSIQKSSNQKFNFSKELERFTGLR